MDIMKGKWRFYIPFIIQIAFVPQLLCGQPSQKEVYSLLSDIYENELFITDLPSSFYKCAYNVLVEENGNNVNTVGDRCFLPLLEADSLSFTFLDEGRELYKQMKPAFVADCTRLKTVQQCTCIHNFLIYLGIGYLDFLQDNFYESSPYIKVEQFCSNR